MILVRSRQQLLSGNKFLFLILFLFYACSPKTRPTNVDRDLIPAVTEDVEPKDINKGGPAKFTLLLPFNAAAAKSNMTAAQLESAGMAIDFYQGFLLGVDSASVSGRNYQVQVVDSESKSVNFSNLHGDAKFKEADIIIGPVFPENIRQTNLGNKFLISPIAAADPKDFNNTKLISLTPNLTLHATGVANFVRSSYNSNNHIVVLLTGPKGDEIFSAGVDKGLNISGQNYHYQKFDGISSFETKVQRAGKYVVVLGTTDRATVLQSIDKLIALKNRYALNVTLIGHPSWEKQGYPVEKLQTLNTIISSGHFVNFKAPQTVAFVQKYRSKYGLEPTEFAFKGFDAGSYFSNLLVDSKSAFPGNILERSHTGLHNAYSFEFDAERGYVNKSVWMLRYKDFQLIPVN